MWSRSAGKHIKRLDDFQNLKNYRLIFKKICWELRSLFCPRSPWKTKTNNWLRREEASWRPFLRQLLTARISGRWLLCVISFLLRIRSTTSNKSTYCPKCKKYSPRRVKWIQGLQKTELSDSTSFTANLRPMEVFYTGCTVLCRLISEGRSPIGQQGAH